MKEAAGEANMTVVTIVLIAIVLGVGTFIVTNILGNADREIEDDAPAYNQTNCEAAGGNWDNNKCNF